MTRLPTSSEGDIHEAPAPSPADSCGLVSIDSLPLPYNSNNNSLIETQSIALARNSNVEGVDNDTDFARAVAADAPTSSPPHPNACLVDDWSLARGAGLVGGCVGIIVGTIRGGAGQAGGGAGAC